MAGRIPRVFINDLLARTDIVDLIDARVKLKKQGKNYHACCPFHNEKTPSFTVNGEKQFYHCFGCGAHGNAIDFLMNYDRLEFVESIEELATLYGLEVPYESGNGPSQLERHQRQSLYQLMTGLRDFYQQALAQSQSAGAREYLAQRGLSEEVIKHFSIGFAPAGWDNALKRFGRNPDDRQSLIDAGMLVTNDQGRSYDRFRERVMFPIHDKRGRVIGFGGRVLGDGMPKYLNSPETDIFHKGRQLYGLYEAQKNYPEPPKLLVVEGYMDVVALAQFGVDYAVASLGTSTTAEHIQLLFRATNTVICCYDGDRAGREAAWRALETALPYMNDGRQLRFMFLPDGEDPDTLVRKEGKEAFEARMEQAMPLSGFLFDTLMPQVDLRSPDGRAQLSTLALPLISQVPGETLRIYLRQELGNKLGILDDSQLEKLLPKQAENAKPPAQPQLKRTTMRILIGLLIQNPQLAMMVPSLDGLEQSDLPGFPLFVELVSTCVAQPGLTTGQLLELYRGTKFSQSLETLATWNHMIVDDEVDTMFKDALGSMYDDALERRLEELIARDRTHVLSAEERREFWTLSQALKKQ
ncbi:DNA primase [bacteria symbiont BFo1 of Frankliniella occidentalis]|jgi:DNA primase|uniref:DNA primase n=1 Tax=Erwinia aphidicola TaxID=68334 RepID=UPI000664514C|nr:DNA primase [Erwinia aphidicola]KMV72584.1 DNA primase [bacteria symbiont BFo1 of Frankliniella occidentalis]PIJ57924.1 DNA primase [Erwinia sp. OLMDLW33]KYP86427.1 DNA primase [bacteria symbiont BFo1 of Frankliniella occidentalis]KYP91958.1 DNA primase [bacteria symbiont BFo1 of Frankliniella occidentalis]MBD1376199.1 DNA primase [Erwinia aphidicola]